MTARDGFTLVELLVVVLIVGILARIGIPNLQHVVQKARAAEAMASIQAVRVAAYAYNTETHRWPPDYNPGVMPTELEPYLGTGFLFEGEGYQLDWENWVLPDGRPKHPETEVMLGISITTSDARLGEAFVELLGDGSAAHYTLGSNYTFVLLGL